MVKAERGGDHVQAVQTGRLIASAPSAPRLLLLEELVEVGSQAEAHPVPQLAAEPPGDRRPLTPWRCTYGAIAGLRLLVVIAEVACGVKLRVRGVIYMHKTKLT